MAITLSGEFTSPRTPDEVYDFLCDANKFGPLLPDFESMSVEDATHFTVKARVVLGNIRGMAEIKMELAESVRPIRAQYQGRGKAVGGQIAISVGFDLSPLAEGTRIAWQGEASVFGKLALLAGGMLEPVSRKNIHQLMDALQSSLAYPPAQGGTQPVPSEATQSAPAEQPVRAPQELPSAAEQGTSAEQLGSPPPRNCRD